MNLEVAWVATYDWFLDHGWKIAVIIIVSSAIRRFGMIIIGRIIGRSINRSNRFESQRDKNLRIETLKSLLSSVLKVVTWFIVVLLILSELNVLQFVLPLLATAGLASLLIGFGIQTFVKDFISGIFIVAENQYRVGDYIAAMTTVGGAVEGTVTQISLRTTVIRDHDGAIHFIPNGNVTRVANQTLDYAKINIELNLPFDSDLEAAERTINEVGKVLSSDERFTRSIIQPPYYHGVQTFNTDGVTIEVRAKTVPAEQWHIASELQKQLVATLNNHQMFMSKKRTAIRKS